MFPERWFDLVLVLRCSNTLLYDRLQARQYSGRKLEENVQAEIFQTILDEARESYRWPADTEIHIFLSVSTMHCRSLCW